MVLYTFEGGQTGWLACWLAGWLAQLGLAWLAGLPVPAGTGWAGLAGPARPGWAGWACWAWLGLAGWAGRGDLETDWGWPGPV